METVDQIRDDSSREQVCLNLHRERGLDPDAGSTWEREKTGGEAERILLLEAENLRLRQLIAELLVRNQQVRELSDRASQLEDGARSPAERYARFKL